MFTNILLADEINRTPPKTQSALLEAMEERQVSADGVTRPLPDAVPGRRDAEPDRVRGHLHAARGAARPLPAQARARHPRARRRARRCSAATPTGSTRATSPRPGVRPVLDADELARGAAAPRHPSTRRRRRARLRRRPRPRHPAQPLGAARRQPARRRPRCSRPRKAWAWLSGYRRDHARPRADDGSCRCWRHRIQLRPEAELEGVSVDAVLRLGPAADPGADLTPSATMVVSGRLALLVALGAVPVVLLGGRGRRRVARALAGSSLCAVAALADAAAAPIRARVARRAPGPAPGAARRARRRRAAGCERRRAHACAGACATPGSRRPGAPADRTRARHPAGRAPRRRRRRCSPRRRGERRVAIRRRCARTARCGSRARQATHRRRAGAIRVLPPFTARKHLPSRLARLRELDGNTSVQVRGQGTEFDSLREYVRGDDVRSIDWRATRPAPGSDACCAPGAPSATATS